MKFTNKYNLPQAFVRAVVNDSYSKGASDYSATGLANPPRVNALMHKYAGEVEVDVSSRVASIIGQGAHSIAERAARPEIDICEERIFAKFLVDGVEYTVSAQLDLYERDSKTMYDWKTTKAYAFSKKAGSGKKPEWVDQLNIGAELLRRNGEDPQALRIIAMLKDFKDAEAGKGGMPESEVVEVELPLWSSEQATAHIESRIRLQIAALKELPLCTTKENWGGRRCGKWCDASSVCSQYQESLKTGLLKAEGE